MLQTQIWMRSMEKKVWVIQNRIRHLTSIKITKKLLSINCQLWILIQLHSHLNMLLIQINRVIYLKRLKLNFSWRDLSPIGNYYIPRIKFKLIPLDNWHRITCKWRMLKIICKKSMILSKIDLKVLMKISKKSRRKLTNATHLFGTFFLNLYLSQFFKYSFFKNTIHISSNLMFKIHSSFYGDQKLTFHWMNLIWRRSIRIWHQM